MPDLPAHASPALEPSRPETPDYRKALSALNDPGSDFSNHDMKEPPPELLSPKFTPPSTPGTGTPRVEREALSIPVDTSLLEDPAPRLLQTLPEVECVVRARIPTTGGQEMYLHLYQNNVDNKEHLAIVFGKGIRSRSLDAVRPGETEMDRMIRGAYTGRLFPGRTTSGFDETSSAHVTHTPSLSSGFEASTPSQVPRVPPSANPSRTKLENALKAVGPTPGAMPSTAQENMPLVRIHSECYTGETVWSARCDCGEQLDEAARLMSLPSAAKSGGVIIYLRQEGRGIGLGEKLKAYNLQDLGNDTVEANILLRHPADARSYGLATSMLVDLGLSQAELGADSGIRLLTNNPDKIRAVEGPNREIRVRERVEMVPLSWKSGGIHGFNSPEVRGYLETKIKRMGHMLETPES